MLITLLLPTSGTARVMGFDVVRDTTEVRKRIGYVFGGDRGLYDRVSGIDNLRYFAELYGVEPSEQKRRIAALLELVGLTGRENEKVEGYSRGMRQRLHIARGLLHDPEVIFMDEPSIGLDPVGARELRQTVQSLVDAGKTVLLTTHYMFEADALCDRIAVINAGRIVALGTGADLKDAIAERTIVEIETFGVTDEAVERLRGDARRERGQHGGARPEPDPAGPERARRCTSPSACSRCWATRGSARWSPASRPWRTPTSTSSPPPATTMRRAARAASVQ